MQYYLLIIIYYYKVGIRRKIIFSAVAFNYDTAIVIVSLSLHNEHGRGIQ